MLIVDFNEKAELRSSADWRYLELGRIIFFLTAYCYQQLLHLITDKLLLCLYAEELVVLTILFL